MMDMIRTMHFSGEPRKRCDTRKNFQCATRRAQNLDSATALALGSEDEAGYELASNPHTTRVQPRSLHPPTWNTPGRRFVLAVNLQQKKNSPLPPWKPPLSRAVPGKGRMT